MISYSGTLRAKHCLTGLPTPALRGARQCTKVANDAAREQTALAARLFAANATFV